MTQLLSNLLTNSRLKCARQCARLHFFKYLLGYRPTEDKAELAFGNLMHKGLEAWWLAVKAGLPEAQWFENAIAALLAVADIDPFDMAKAQVLMKGYHCAWAGDAPLYEVLGVEERFEFALVNPATGGTSHSWKVAGKLDVRVRRRSDGTSGFIEHKTSAEDVSLGSPYWQVLRMDSQVSTYFDGASALGDRAEWCLYDVIGKPGQRPLKATPVEARKYTKKDNTLYAGQRLEDETPDEYGLRCLAAMDEAPGKFFTRGEVVRLESELDEARAEIWQQAASLRENVNEGRHPRNSDSCRRGNSLCPFFAVCTKQADLDDLRLFIRTDDVHPELAGIPTRAAGPKEEAFK